LVLGAAPATVLRQVAIATAVAVSSLVFTKFPLRFAGSRQAGTARVVARVTKPPLPFWTGTARRRVCKCAAVCLLPACSSASRHAREVGRTTCLDSAKRFLPQFVCAAALHPSDLCWAAARVVPDWLRLAAGAG